MVLVTKEIATNTHVRNRKQIHKVIKELELRKSLKSRPNTSSKTFV